MHSYRSVVSSLTFLILSVMLAIAGVAAPVVAQGSTTVVVHRNNIAATKALAKSTAATPWYRNALTGGATIGFMSGPGTPALGTGSLRVGTASGSSKAQLFNYAYAGKRLADLTSLSYQTYRDPSSTNSLGQAPALNLEVDYAGTGTSYTALVFEPIYNTSQGALAAGIWQSWDALSGGSARWWSTQNIPGVCASSCYVTWATILASNPNARITSATQTFSQYGGLGISLGSGWAGVFNGSVDRFAVGFSGTETVYDFEPGCGLDCYVSTSGNDANDGTSFADAKRTIQAGVNTVQPGGTVHVADGTYAEDVLVNKAGVTLVGTSLPTIEGVPGGDSATVRIGASDVTIDGFEITRQGNNVAQWNDPALNSAGIAIQGQSITGALITGVALTGNRTAIDINNSNGHTVVDSVITDNHTGMILRNQTDDLSVLRNRIADNRTVGVLFLDASGGTNSPVQQAHGSVFHRNDISGNWYGQVVDRQSGGALPAPGGTNRKDFGDNWWGSTTPSITTANSAEPGYSVLIPVAYGGTATDPGIPVFVAGPASGNIDFTPALVAVADAGPGATGAVTHLKVHTLGAQLGTEGRIQEGLDTTVANGIVDVAPGTYSETATARTTTQVGPTYQFGLYVGTDRDGVTVRGVDAASSPITSSAGTLARITTNATNNFGSSGTFVYGADVTFQGLEFGTNSPSSNKTFEVIGSGFSLLDSYVNDVFGSVYLNDWTYDVDEQLSSIATFTIDGNRFAADNQITIASGTGYGHPESGRSITNNTFVGPSTGPSISFRGAAGTGGVPWYTYPVGGAVITGNTFGPADINIRATDTYAEAQFDWEAFRDDNTFARLVWVEDGSQPAALRSFSYTSGTYAFVNARQLGGRIDERGASNRPAGVQIAQAGDTIHVHSGTYPEQAIIDKPDLTVQGYGPTRPLLDDGGTATGNGILITGDDVTLANVKVQGYGTGVRLGGGADSLLDGVSVLDVESVDNAGHGLFASAISGLSDITIDGGIYSRNSNTGSGAGRGIAIWDGPKANIVITDVIANDNALVGIDVNDGTVTGLTITGNTVVGNLDSGIGVLGAKGPGANLIANNTVTDNGRFGIEIKNPTGSGAASGAGSVVVSGNIVSLTAAANRAQDLAGIAIFRRSVGVLNADQPTGAYVVGNTIGGFQNSGAGDGFGIVVEGTGHTVTQNVVAANEVGVQAQAANPSNPTGDATQTGTDWFDRGNAASYSGTVAGNSISGNDLDFRAVGLTSTADASGNWWGTTSESAVGGSIVGDVDFTPYLHTGTDTGAGVGFQGDFSSLDVVRSGAQVGGGPRIQEAIDMVTGSTVYVHAGDYVEDVVADVADLNLYGAHQGDPVDPRTFGDATEATIHGQLSITAADVTVDGFSLTHTTTSSSVVGILVTATGHGATVVRNLVDGVSTDHASGVAQAVYLEHGPDGVALTGNAITNVSSQRSAKGMYIGDTSASNASLGVSITGNTISGVTSSTRGAYGIQANNGAGAVLTISGNTISGLSGSWVHGIGIEGDAPGLTIDHNVISGLTAAGIDKAAVFFEDDASYADAEVHRNSFDVGPATFGVAVHPSLSVSTPIKATCNWWGSATGPGAIAGGTGSLVGPGVDGNPWLTSSDLDGACDGLLETVAPTAALTFAEGTAALNGGAFDNATASFTSDATIGTLTDNGDGSWTWTLAANDPDNDGPASGTITVTATTALGATATTSFDYTITNVAPSGTFVAPAQVAVGDTFVIGIDPTVDPSTGDTFSYTFTCGVASPVTGAAASTTCAAPSSGQVGSTIHVTGLVTDDDGGTSPVYEADVLVVAALTITPTSHDFGSVQVGESSAPVTFTLTNQSDVPYDIDEVGFFVIATNHFEIVAGSSDHCSGTTLGAHASCSFEVVFTPQAPKDPHQTTLGVQFDGTQPPLPKATSALTGTGIAPKATVTPGSIDFGSRAIGAGPSAVQTITVANTGDTGSSLTVTSITRTGSSAFDETHEPLAPLGAGDALDIDVVFDPSSVGGHNGSIVITTSAGSFSVALSGTGQPGPVLSVTPSTHNFGDVTVGDSKSRTFRITNTGTAPLSGLVVSVTGDDLSIVTGDGTCDEATSLGVDESCTIRVRYQPDEVGDDTGSLDATADGGLSDSSSLAGSGVAGEPIVTVTPDAYEFDPIVVGAAPAVQSFTVTNTGDAALTGIDITITGAPAFTIVTGAGTDCEAETTSLAPDATCVVWVQFAPGAGGDKSATLKVLSTNAGNGTVNVPLSGTALEPELSISPSGYNFGDVTVGHAKSRTFTVTNTGTAGLTGLDVTVTGDDLSIVADDSTCDETTTLGAGEDCEVRVRYQPDEAGDDTGSLSATADGGLSDTASLRGAGVPAKGLVTVTPDEGAFGSIEVATSAVIDFTVGNTGDASLTFSNVTLTGSSTFAIEASGGTDCLTEDATLAPGDTCVVRVRFAPGGVGDRSGTLKIQSDAANSTVNVPLDGTATPRPSDVSVTPNPYDYGDVVFRGTKTRTFTVTNSGGTPVTITSVTRTGSSTFTVLAADDECASETLGTAESCTFRVRFQAPSSTAGSKNATIHVAGTGFDEIEVPVTATAEAFKAKVDAFITDKTDKRSNYVGVGVYCKSSCSRQQAVENVRRGRTFVYRVRIRNNGNGVDNIRVRLYQTGSKASIRKIQVLRNGNQDVTSRVTNGSYVARDMNPGAEIYFWVKVTVRTNAVRGRVNYVQISGQSTRTSPVKDVVRAKTRVR